MTPPTIITLPNKDSSILQNQYGTGNYTVKLSQSLKFSGEWEVYLLAATIPYTWYTISNVNNTLLITGAMMPKEVKIPNGNYSDIPTLVDEIQTRFEKIGISFSTNHLTMRTTIVIKNGRWLSGPILEILGFKPDAILPPGTHISPNISDITGRVPSLLIYISIIENTYIGSIEAPLLATIPIKDSKPGDIIHWKASGPDYEVHKLKNSSFQTIEIDIRDSKGNSIDFNSHDISIRIGIRKSN